MFTLFSTNAKDFLLTAPVGDTAGDNANAARPFCGGGDICGDMETSPRPGITAHDFLLAPPMPLSEEYTQYGESGTPSNF